MSDFASRLRSLRESQGLSVAALAKLAGLNRQALYRLESGEREPTLETAQKLASALGKRLRVFEEPK